MVKPYSTWVSAGSLVVQETEAEEKVMLETRTEEITGAVESLLIVTVMGEEVVELLEESLATAVRV